MGKVVSVDPALVERCIMTLAEHGAAGETGVARATYTPEWLAAQNMVMDWAREAGMAVRMDAVGNVWGRFEGTEGGKPIVSGSHIDSQCPGGRYDGALGVIAAYVAMKTLVERYGPPRRTLELVSLCEEEGSRYPAADFWGSRAIIGRIAAGDPEQVTALDGGTIADGMRSVGLDPARCADAIRSDIGCFIELHIEQGPLLEMAGYPVGIVTGITGPREYWVKITGRADHAGARPMDTRRDPMAGAAEIISGAINTALMMGRPAVTTVGRISAEPGATPIVPEAVTFTIDARHPDREQRALLYERHEELMRSVAKRRGLEIEWSITGEHEPCPCDPDLVRTFEQAAADQGIPAMLIPSGAAHDSQQLALIAPVAMIFVQSRDGRSHTPEEFTSIEHAVAGIDVLAEGLHRLAW
ncbi:MAG: Zn-dependent hydrolase [Thermomicrobiales bacterium]